MGMVREDPQLPTGTVGTQLFQTHQSLLIRRRCHYQNIYSVLNCYFRLFSGVVWAEDPLCSYQAYIYTPMACDFATIP